MVNVVEINDYNDYSFKLIIVEWDDDDDLKWHVLSNVKQLWSKISWMN